MTRKRLFSLLYMIKVIDAAGDRVGYEEFKDIEYYQYQIKRGTKRPSSWTTPSDGKHGYICGRACGL